MRILTKEQQFDSRYECITRWKAHDQLILASAIAHHDGKAIYVTGGNDDCIAIWDIGDHVKDPRKGSVASNGMSNHHVFNLQSTNKLS